MVKLAMLFLCINLKGKGQTGGKGLYREFVILYSCMELEVYSKRGLLFMPF